MDAASAVGALARLVGLENMTANATLAQLPPGVLEQATGATRLVNRAVGLPVTPLAVVYVSVLSLVAVLLFLCAACCILARLRRQKRARENAMLVEMASVAPLDDGDEHEIEQHTHPRTAAPGDSDVDDDHGTVFKK